MPTDRFNNPRRFHWGLVGVSMVTIAVGLAIIGIVMAFQQAHSVASRSLDELQLRARFIALTSSEQVHNRIQLALRQFARNACDSKVFRVPEVPPDPIDDCTSYLDQPQPFSLVREPEWMRWTFVWDSVQFPQDVERIVEDRAKRQDVVNIVSTSVTTFLAERAPFTEFGFVESSLGPLAILSYPCNYYLDRKLTVIGRIDLDALQETELAPLLSMGEGLELVASAEKRDIGATTLAGVMNRWAIQPSQAFLTEQRHAVLWQTGTYAGLTIVALLAMFGLMWLLSRLARREMALAELKSNFVADVSHELKTPLAMIRMYAETLQSGRVNSEPKRSEYYAIMVRESTRLANLINNILDFARIEAGRREYTLEPTDVAEAVRSTYDTYREELERNEFEHHLSIDGELPPVNADRGAIVQILVNLISNAMKYSGEERFLSIDVEPDTRRDHHGVIIAVEDHGIGIRPEDRARVFEGFFRAADGRVQRQGGTGLGLTLVKHIVDAHGGILDIESRLVKGTVFRVFLPAIDGAAGDRKPARSGSES